MLNKIIIMGRIVRDPDLRYTQNQKPVVSFTLAVDRDGQEKQTDFIDCVAWNKTAEFVDQWFSKGQMAVVEGRLQIRDWIDRDGDKRRSAEVLCDRVFFGEAKKKDGQKAESKLQEIDDTEGHLPF
jgi:single-strand DNA-binding protein